MTWKDNYGSMVAAIKDHEIVAYNNGTFVISGPIASGSLHFEGSKTLQDAMASAEEYVNDNPKIFS